MKIRKKELFAAIDEQIAIAEIIAGELEISPISLLDELAMCGYYLCSNEDMPEYPLASMAYITLINRQIKTQEEK